MYKYASTAQAECFYLHYMSITRKRMKSCTPVQMAYVLQMSFLRVACLFDFAVNLLENRICCKCVENQSPQMSLHTVETNFAL